MSDTEMFAFEQDFVDSLRCIPMAVRMKLDRSGIKLTLRQWSRFTVADRLAMLELPCRTAAEVELYAARLTDLVAARSGETAQILSAPPEPLWLPLDPIPPVVADFAMSRNMGPLPAKGWRALSELQRYTLVKLTRDNHDNVNFAPALREFGLA